MGCDAFPRNMRACAPRPWGKPSRGSLPDVRRRAGAALDRGGARRARERGRTRDVLRPRREGRPRAGSRRAHAGRGPRGQLHGNRHLRHTEHDRDTIERDTDAALARLDVLGVRPSLWRLPWGRAASWTPAIAADRGLRIVGWDADTHDWRGDSAATMLAAVAGELRDGCIVLAHDGLGPGALRDGCAETVALVGDLARLAGERGLDVRAGGRERSGRRVTLDRGASPTRSRASPRARPRATGSRTRRSPTTPSPPSSTPASSRPACRSPSSSPSSATSRAPTPPSPGSSTATSTPSSASRSHGEDPLRERELAAVADGPAPPRRLGRRPAARRGRAARASATAAAARGQDVLLRRRRRAARDRARRGETRLAATSTSSTAASASGRPRPGSRARGCAPPRATAWSSTARRCSPCSARPGEIAREPWFARDAVRTAASWAGVADAAADEALAPAPAARTEPTTLERLAAGRIRGRAAHDRRCGSPSGGAPRPTPAPCSRESVAYLRHEIADAARALLDEAARACGSRPFATGGGLDRARRDLELFTAPAPPGPASSRAPARPRCEEAR